MNNTEYEKQEKLLRIESILKTSLNNTKISLVQSDNDTWAFDVTNNILTYPKLGPLSLTEISDYQAIGFTLHEIGHALFTKNCFNNFFVPSPTYGFVQMVNVFEDVRTEKALHALYPGTYDSLLHLFGAFRQTFSSVDKMPAYENFLLNVFCTQWGVPNVFKNDGVRDLFHTLEDDIKKAFYQKDTLQLVDFLFTKTKIWNTIKVLIEDDDNDQEHKKQSSDLFEKEKKETAKDFKPEPSEAEKELDKLKKRQEEAQKSEKENEEEEKTRKESKKSIDYRNGRITYEQGLQKVKKDIEILTRQLKTILKDNREKRHGGNYLSGELNTKKLYKFACNNTRLFTRKQIRNSKDYSIILVIDESYSMYPRDSYQSFLSTIILAETLNNLGIDFGIVGYNETSRVYKQVDDIFSWASRREIERINEEPTLDGGNNTNTWLGLLQANKMLLETSDETNKLVFCLTDGEPNHSLNRFNFKKSGLQKLQRNFSITGNLEQNAINNLSKIATVLGLGIGDYLNSRDMRTLFKGKYTSIQNSTLIQKKLKNLLRRYIKRT